MAAFILVSNPAASIFLNRSQRIWAFGPPACEDRVVTVVAAATSICSPTDTAAVAIVKRHGAAVSCNLKEHEKIVVYNQVIRLTDVRTCHYSIQCGRR